MRLSISLIFVFLSIASLVFSQLPLAPNVTDEKGKRQGDWVIYYDLDWEEISDTSIVEFYRKISYINDKPKGLVTDYYATGNKQWEGELSSDRPDVANGVSRYFYDNGNILMNGSTKKDKYVGNWKNYTLNAEFSHNTLYEKGKEQGLWMFLFKADKLIGKDKRKKVIELLELAIEESEKIKNKEENNLYAEIISYQANIYSQLEKFEEALILNNRSLKITERIYGKENLTYVRAVHNLAQNYSKLKDFNISIKLYKECLLISKNFFKRDSASYSMFLNNLAYNYSKIENHQKAIEIINKNLKIREVIYGENSLEYVTELNNLAYNYSEIGEYKNSIEINEKSLKIRGDLYGENSLQYVTALNNLAFHYSEIGDFQMAIEINKKSLKIRGDLYGKSHPNYSIALYNLADNYFEIGNYKKSLDLRNKSLSIYYKKHGIYNDDYASTLQSISQDYQALLNFKKALEINYKCLSIYAKIYGDTSHYYAQNLNNIADNYSFLGDYDKSLEFRTKSFLIYKENYDNNHFGYSQTLNDLAIDHFKVGNYSKSLQINLECLSIRKNVYGLKSYNYSETLNNLALCYLKMGNYHKSIELNKESLEIREKLYGKNHQDYAISLSNLAESYSMLKNYRKSLELQKKSLSIFKNLYGKNNSNYASCLNNLAWYYSQIGSYQMSLDLNNESLIITENIYGKNHPDYAINLNNLSIDYNRLGFFSKSHEIITKSLAIINRIYGKSHPKYALMLGNLADNYRDMKFFLACDTLYLQAFKISEDSYSNNYNSLSEKENENYIKELKLNLEYLTNYFIFRKSKKPELASVILSANLNLKGALLSYNKQIQEQVLKSNKPKLFKLYKNWEYGKIQLGNYYETTLQKLEENGVDLKAEEERVNSLEQELSRKSLSFAESQKRYSWEDVKNKLNPNESYLELIRTNYYDFENDRSTDTVYYAALIIHENTKDYPELVILEKGTQLEQSGFKYYSSFSSGRNKQRLDEYSYQNFWSAIAEKLKGKKRIYVSSDGVYNKINLNVLYNTETGKYLGEEVDIRLVTSGRDLFRTYQETNEELTAVLVGSPKYDLIEEQVQDDDLLVSRDLQQNWIDSLTRGWSVSSLPGTAIEVSNISNLMTKNNWEVTTYTEEEAMEGKVKSVSSPTVLHIATHGYFFEDVNKEKETPTRMMGVDSKKATQNPLLRSGLLFAGAKNTLNGNSPESGDNGLLTSYEASYMDLRGTELVVLSACNTARGEIKNGEGVYGLQRAIQQAGAKNIIMSMWKVDDKVTQEFMTNFYDLWLSGKTKREAFNQTQMIIKEKYKYPYYWGAFVMIGN